MNFIIISLEFFAAVAVVACSLIALKNEFTKMEHENILTESLMAHIKLTK